MHGTKDGYPKALRELRKTYSVSLRDRKKPFGLGRGGKVITKHNEVFRGKMACASQEVTGGETWHRNSSNEAQG